MAITKEMTIYEIVQQHPETQDVFVANGFDKFSDAKALETVGKFLKLETATKTKGYDLDTYISLLEEKIAATEAGRDINARVSAKAQATVSGLLPCPVRIPLLEQFDGFIKQFEAEKGITVNYRLEAASVGADWMEETLKDAKTANDLPDIFISAGFEAFFDKKLFGRFRDEGVFVDTTTPDTNADFASVGIKDPKRQYGVIATVAAVFLADKKELGDLPIPKSWADILKPEYAGKVALPVSDFDLFNAILATIQKQFGDDGIRALARSMMSGMHPAMMVKNLNKQNTQKPAVTIMPYFFTKMLKDIPAFAVVWPEDGAIISPVFMLVKKDRADELRPVADFLDGIAVGEILAQRGLFPSVHPQVKNILPENAPFMWVGWDYIENNDIGAVVRRADALFRDELEKGEVA